MAHFAKISEQNEVLEVLTINDKDTLDSNNVETESVGQQFLQNCFNWPAHLWIKTSYNTRRGKYIEPNSNFVEAADQSKAFRGNYAQIGMIWDSENNIFIDQKPYPSWIKNVSEARWQSPVGDVPDFTAEQLSQLQAGTHHWVHEWDEVNQTWNLIDLKA